MPTPSEEQLQTMYDEWDDSQKKPPGLPTQYKGNMQWKEITGEFFEAIKGLFMFCYGQIYS